MPSTGFYLFLRYVLSRRRICTVVCQCPQRASTYFFNTNVTMEQILNAVCQCPQRASTYFFKLKSRREAQKEVCVNALNGLLLISSMNTKDTLQMQKLCQCPQRASTYFFWWYCRSWWRSNQVSMPSTGFYLFLLQIIFRD